jgi:hypothetical protein
MALPQVRLIHSGLQSGEKRTGELSNRFNGFSKLCAQQLRLFGSEGRPLKRL